MFAQKGASDAPLSDGGLGRGEVVSRGEKTWQEERAQGGRAGLAQSRAGDTCRARMSSEERDKRGKQGKMQANPRCKAARGEGDAGSQQRQIGAPNCAQSDTMPMNCIEPYPPHHQGTDGGEAGRCRRRGNPPEGVPGEGAQAGLQDRERDGG